MTNLGVDPLKLDSEAFFFVILPHKRASASQLLLALTYTIAGTICAVRPANNFSYCCQLGQQLLFSY